MRLAISCVLQYHCKEITSLKKQQVASSRCDEHNYIRRYTQLNVGRWAAKNERLFVPIWPLAGMSVKPFIFLWISHVYLDVCLGCPLPLPTSLIPDPCLDLAYIFWFCSVLSSHYPQTIKVPETPASQCNTSINTALASSQNTVTITVMWASTALYIQWCPLSRPDEGEWVMVRSNTTWV